MNELLKWLVVIRTQTRVDFVERSRLNVRAKKDKRRDFG